MLGKAKRINVYLNDADYDRVAVRAVRAGVTIPAYLRRIACGVLPQAKTNDFVTHGLALMASELDIAAAQAKEKTSTGALLSARNRIRTLMKQHLGGEHAGGGE